MMIALGICIRKEASRNPMLLNFSPKGKGRGKAWSVSISFGNALGNLRAWVEGK